MLYQPWQPFLLSPFFVNLTLVQKFLVAILNEIFIKFQMTIIRLKQAFNVGLRYTILGNHFVTPLFCKPYTCTNIFVAILNVIFIKFQMIIIRLKQAFNVSDSSKRCMKLGFSNWCDFYPKIYLFSRSVGDHLPSETPFYLVSRTQK